MPGLSRFGGHPGDGLRWSHPPAICCRGKPCGRLRSGHCHARKKITQTVSGTVFLFHEVRREGDLAQGIGLDGIFVAPADAVYGTIKDRKPTVNAEHQFTCGIAAENGTFGKELQFTSRGVLDLRLEYCRDAPFRLRGLRESYYRGVLAGSPTGAISIPELRPAAPRINPAIARAQL